MIFALGIEASCRAAQKARDLADGLRNNPVLPVQGGLVNGAPFFLMVGAGFDGAIVNGLNYKTKRLLALLEWFLPIETDWVPDNSILREFIGGSILKDFKVWGG